MLKQQFTKKWTSLSLFTHLHVVNSLLGVSSGAFMSLALIFITNFIIYVLNYILVKCKTFLLFLLLKNSNVFKCFLCLWSRFYILNWQWCKYELLVLMLKIKSEINIIHVMFILINFLSIFKHYDMSYFIKLNNKGGISTVYCNLRYIKMTP